MNTIIIGILLAFPLPPNAQAEEITPQVDRVTNLYLAIEHKETGGNRNAKGQSGEQGNLQFMPSTFNSLSKKYLGHVVEPTPINQDLVAVHYLKEMVDKGLTDYEIALNWNSGCTCEVKGVNKYGVEYDSIAYANSVVALINRK
jgi:hypothetical protein